MVVDDYIVVNRKDANYKRRAIASLVQAAYLLELDRQENRTQDNSLASEFWIPLNYKPTQILIDQRDGSIFGAIFEWDRFKPFKPIGAPRAVLALRGTLIRVPTVRRDFVDDFRFAAWESLKDSVRFKVATDAVKSVSKTYGCRNVCIAGHSLGAGLGLQVGKELAKERINVETHVFNPPAVSLAISLGNIGEMAEYVWSGIKDMLPSGTEAQVSNSVDEAQVSNSVDETYIIRLKKMISRLSCFMDSGLGRRRWVPHIYVNKNDWISYFYIHTHGTKEEIGNVENVDPTVEQNEAKLFVVSMEDQKFREAHGLKQWWSNDGNHDNKVTSMQLKSLNSGTLSQVVLFYYPQYVSLATSCINIREASDYVWSILKCVLSRISSKAQINNDGEVSSGIDLVGLIPSLSGLKDTGYWVCKWIPRMYVGAKEKMVGKENRDLEDGQITPKLLIFSKEQLKFLAAHGLEQWWSNAVELQKTICDGKLVSRKVKSLYIGTLWEVTKGSNLAFISLAAYWVWNCVPHRYVNKNCGIEEKEVHKKENVDCANARITSKLCVVSKEQQKFLTTHGLEQWWPSDADLQQAIQESNLMSRKIRSLYTETSWEVTKRLNPLTSLPICFANIREKEEFAWKWNSIKSVMLSNSESQASNDYDNKTPYVSLQSWMSPLSSFKDTGFAVVKKASPMLNLPFVSPVMSHGNNEEKGNFVSSSEIRVSNDSDKTSCEGLKNWTPSLSGLKDAAIGIGKLVPYLYSNKSDAGIAEKMVDKENKGPLK
ncbi:unnamed protein product [Lathyrus sativus]|nr:unnamed protein product [Lathyrus sativus]